MVRLPDGRLHYLDEARARQAGGDGARQPVVGYLYRNFIPPLVEAGYRVIVADLLGAGRSDKPDRPEVYKIRRHTRTDGAAAGVARPWGCDAGAHDWGMHSLSWAIHHPERLRGLFILNTIAHRRREEINLPLPIKLFRDRGTGPLLVKRLDVVRRLFLFRFGIVHRDRLTPRSSGRTSRRTRPQPAVPGC